MKAAHLKDLPPTRIAGLVVHRTRFTPNAHAWLHCTLVNYCTFDPDAPKKDTIIFNNLPRGALQHRCCGAPQSACLVPNGRLHTSVKEMNSAEERAAWPAAFVRYLFAACISGIDGARRELLTGESDDMAVGAPHAAGMHNGAGPSDPNVAGRIQAAAPLGRVEEDEGLALALALMLGDDEEEVESHGFDLDVFLDAQMERLAAAVAEHRRRRNAPGPVEVDMEDATA